MIERKLHYVWMGKGQKSELIMKCIKSWEKYMSDFEIIEWNEDNFNIEINQFVKEAYENKKWAFVSDYVRLHVLYNHGGIYLDTDMEILRPLDRFLEVSAFSGFESAEYIPTGLIGAVQGHPWIKDQLEYYNDALFINSNRTLNLTPNVVNITNMTIEDYGLVLNNKYQILKNDLHIYPKEYFCPSDYGDSNKQKEKKITTNSYSIHHYNGSWLSPSGKLKVKIRNLIGKSEINKIKTIIKRGM
ncbi:glycosyltransferase family 32 protein [Paenibacillus silagei]|uniref:Mannosyltransferase OCH1-like enzyme n=1 Tax=Paenibacillus silagei TaxID=1670801 RepID=A0ABS4NY85_9BACL|nr:glycosyltransferase [Paenibacillus silagei]MBP2114400.1 mannosyltransferase OCH1-like enzyme [Paenibacillus silagei]